MVDSRFLHPYYILNALLPLTYVALRIQRLSPNELDYQDMFGVSREVQIYFCLALMLFVRALSAPTVDAYLSSAFTFVRVTVIVCLWHMDTRLMALFLTLWILIYVVCPQPRFRLPSSVVTLNDISFRDRITQNQHRTVYVVWCHAAWSSRSSQLSPILATLIKSYSHPRLNFARLDVSKFPATAESLGVSTSAASKQLPTLICFKQGQEVARIPVVDARGNVPKDYVRGFTASQAAEALKLNMIFNTVKDWEAEARRRNVQKKSE